MSTFSIVSAAPTCELVKELAQRLDSGFTNNGMPLMVTLGEINHLMNACEAWIMTQYAERNGLIYPELET